MNRWLSVSVFMLITVFVFSCKTGKKVQTSTSSTNNDGTGKELAISKVDTIPASMPVGNRGTKPTAGNLEPFLVGLWNAEKNYRTFSGKAKMHYEGMGMKQDFTSNIRIQKDKVIWVHVTAGMGLVSVARILITPDSVRMVNYLDKQVTLMGINDINKLLPAPMEFATMQNLLIGDILNRQGEVVKAIDLGAMWGLQMESSDILQNATYLKEDTTLRTLQMKTKSEGGGLNGTVKYDKYDNSVAAFPFSIERNVNIMNNGRQYLLQMNYVNAEFNTEVNFPFSIPVNYTLKNY